MCIQAWDITLIQFLQCSWDWLEAVMKLATKLGYPHAYLIMVALIYWSLNKKLGLRLGIFLSLVGSINSILKTAFHAPRPFWVSSDIRAIEASKGFGMPSGHAQASTVWLLAGIYLRKKWFWILAILLTFLIGLSRPYLGVHFPTQIIAGWAVGMAVIICFLRFEKGLIWWFQKLKLYQQLIFVMGIAGLIILSGLFILWITGNWELPADWKENALAYLCLEESMLRSYSIATISGNAGAFLGVTMGAILMARAGDFQDGGIWWIRVIRIVLGLACMSLLYFGLHEIKPCETDGFLFAAWRFLGFYLITFLAIYLMPMLYVRLKLMKPDH